MSDPAADDAASSVTCNGSGRHCTTRTGGGRADRLAAVVGVPEADEFDAAGRRLLHDVRGFHVPRYPWIVGPTRRISVSADMAAVVGTRSTYRHRAMPMSWLEISAPVSAPNRAAT